jgi:hypothetical protein
VGQPAQNTLQISTFRPKTMARTFRGLTASQISPRRNQWFV